MSWKRLARLSLLLCLPVIGLGPAREAGAQLDSKLIFSAPDIAFVTGSPSGEWVVANVRNDATHGLLLQRIGSGRIDTILSSRFGIEAVHWIGERTLLVYLKRSGFGRLQEIHFEEIEGEIRKERETVRAPGWLVDPLPLTDGVLLWGFEHEGINTVH